MFGFDKPEDGSEERFRERVRVWTESGVPSFSSAPEPLFRRALPLGQHYFWWLLHNLVAHPVIGLAPFKPAFDFHDWTSRKLNGL